MTTHDAMSKLGKISCCLAVCVAIAQTLSFLEYSILPASAQSKNHSVTKNFHLAAVLGDENRITADEYAKQRGLELSTLQRIYPTRSFICGGNKSQANIVLQSDVILITAHAIYDDQCQLEKQFKNCVLRDINGENYEIESGSLKSGIQIALSMNLPCGIDDATGHTRIHDSIREYDWAVLKLEKRVPNVSPYQIRAPLISEQSKSYTVFATSAANFGKRGNRPSNFQSCSWRNSFETLSGGYMMMTDCDVGGWMSGAPLLAGNVIEGIQVSGTVAENGLPFESRRRFSTALPVSKDIDNALFELTGKRGMRGIKFALTTRTTEEFE